MNLKTILIFITIIILISPVSADFWQKPIIAKPCSNTDGSGFVPGHADPSYIVDGDITTYIQSNSSSAGNYVYCYFEFPEIRKMKTNGFYFGGAVRTDSMNNQIEMSSTNNSDWSGLVIRSGLTIKTTDAPASYPGWYNRSHPTTAVPTEKYIAIGHNMGIAKPLRIYEEVFEFYGTSDYLPIVNFTGDPINGPAPMVTTFTAINITNTTGLSWSFGDGNITSSTINPISHLYQNRGTYTVRLDYFNDSGVAGYVQKNNYITVGAPNATKTKWFQTIDGTNGNIVLNSSIQLNDVENSSWVNATGLINDGMSSITTLEGHTINAYAQSLGYSDADDLGILNDGQPQYIMMWPTFAKNVSEGNVSLYVTVKDKDTKANIVGAGVTASLASGSMSTTTNEAGIAYFIVKNSSMVLITAQAIGQGYQTATTTINTGMASGGSASAAATILLGKNTVIPTFTTAVTTLPGGGTPTPVITILPGCEDTISAAGQEKCRAAQSNQGLSFLSGNLLGLIQICFVVTILYLLGIKLGK